MSGRPSNSVANEPRAAYRTATADSTRLMENITPAKAKIVTTLLNAIKAKESVEVVNARASSEIRWSGLATSPETAKRE